MGTVRETKRAGRRPHGVPSVAIAGYTNAGKSSLLNRLTGAGVLVEDALFATLDPTTRRARAADGRVYTLSDTVGFVRHLPHQLIEAFRSTLEEVAEADLVVHVVDGAHPDPEEQVRAVREVLGRGRRRPVPELLVVNKVDAADEETLLRLKRALARMRSSSPPAPAPASTSCARRSRPGCPGRRWRSRSCVPYDRGDLVARVHRAGEVLATEHAGRRNRTARPGRRRRSPRSLPHSSGAVSRAYAVTVR